MENFTFAELKKLELVSLKQVIRCINTKINSFEKTNLLMKIRFERSNTGGRYADYERLIYKPKTVKEFYELQKIFTYLDKKFKFLKAQAKAKQEESQYEGFEDYKNVPVFIEQNALSASIKINAAYKSSRTFTNNSEKMKRCFYVKKVRIDLDFSKKITNEEFEIAHDLMIDEARSACTRFNEATNSNMFFLEEHNTYVLVAVKLYRLYEFLNSKGITCTWITIRYPTGKKYMARVFLEKGDSVECSLGCVIVHPDSDINSSSIRKTLPRARSKRAIEFHAKQIEDIEGLGFVDVGNELWLSNE